MTMNDVLTLVKTYGDWIIYLLALWVAVSKIAKPIKSIQSVTTMLLWNSLVREHDDYMRKGYCPASDKKRLCDMHAEYRARGLNHLADGWERDIINLPDDPKEE
ncbi:MAG: hypothetical protein GX418_02405 [Clostridiales bacterium]|nr:hypothetical protein [Clostridiales bacterium]